jgi:hypothetical protein
MESDQVVMQFVSLSRVAHMMGTIPDDMADVLRSEKFSDADKAAFADFVLTASKEPTT